MAASRHWFDDQRSIWRAETHGQTVVVFRTAATGMTHSVRWDAGGVASSSYAAVSP